jgi:hypothetical protein
VGTPWVAYMVVGLAISMIVVLGIGLTSMSRKSGNAEVHNQDINKDA